MSQDDRPLLVIRVSSSDYLAIYSCTPFHFQTSKPVFRSTIDTQLQKSTPPNDVQSLTRDLQLCTDDIESWMCSNQLILNEDKTEAILFLTLSLPSNCLPSSVTVGTHQIAFSDKARNLGFILDSNLTMKQHVTIVRKSRMLLHVLYSEHHAINAALPSYSNFIGFRFLNASNTKLPVHVTTQSLVPPPLTFLNYCSCTALPALSALHQTHNASTAKLMAFALSPISVLISGTTSPKISDTLILSFPSKTNSRHFSEHFN